MNVANELLAAAFHYSDLGLILVDEATAIVDWNHWVTRGSGIRLEDARGQSLASLFPNLREGRVQRGVEAALQRGRSTILSRSLGGSPFPFRGTSADHQRFDRIQHTVTIRPVWTGTGNRYCLIQIKDVTTACVREKILREQASRNEQLAAENGSRAEELSALNDRLATSNADLYSFAHAAAHDLQTPIRHIRAMLELVEESDGERLSEESQTWMSHMVRSTERMQSLLRSLLHYAEVNTKEQPMRPVGLASVAREVADALLTRPGFEECAVQIGDLPIIRADESQMYQLLQNLVGNGLKFRRNDVDPWVRVSGDTEGATFVLRVEDNGTGFDPRYAEEIFKPFRRLVSSQEFEGHGLGMATVQKIVARHRGTITASSKPGTGSIFEVRLPDAVDAEAYVEPLAAAS
ncbi:MAG: ATP-binding protein [Myxococcota bacterium]